MAIRNRWNHLPNIVSTSSATRLWIIAMGAADIALITTWLVLQATTGREGNPIMAAVFETLGFHLGAVVKLVVIAVLAVGWRTAVTYELGPTIRRYLANRWSMGSIATDEASSVVVERDRSQRSTVKWGEFLAAFGMALAMTVDAAWNTFQIIAHFAV